MSGEEECPAQSREYEAGGESFVVPRPIVAGVVVVLLLLLGADIVGQFVIPGHTASPVIDGAMLALIGAIVTGTKGPKPDPPGQQNDTPPPPSGRHRGEDSP